MTVQSVCMCACTCCSVCGSLEAWSVFSSLAPSGFVSRMFLLSASIWTNGCGARAIQLLLKSVHIYPPLTQKLCLQEKSR